MVSSFARIAARYWSQLAGKPKKYKIQQSQKLKANTNTGESRKWKAARFKLQANTAESKGACTLYLLLAFAFRL